MANVWKRRVARRGVVVLVLACLLTTMLLVQPASAASTNISVTGGQADVSFTWGTVNTINNVKMTLHDTKCDARPVRGYVDLVTDWGSVWTDTRENAQGCGTTKSWSWSYLRDPYNGRPILCVRVHVSVTSTQQGYSLCVDNPLT